jgi:hypothetical protein
MKPIHHFVAGVALIALWVILAFVAALPNGWVHAPLAVAAIFIAFGIIQQPPWLDS